MNYIVDVIYLIKLILKVLEEIRNINSLINTT